MNWLQIRLFGPYFSSFSTNSYGYYSQMSQNLFSNGRFFASALIVRQAASSQKKCGVEDHEGGQKSQKITLDGLL
jgi:hypothetical protein